MWFLQTLDPLFRKDGTHEDGSLLTDCGEMTFSPSLFGVEETVHTSPF